MKTQNGNMPTIEDGALGVACRACTPEQLKTLTSNLATQLAFRYLCPADERDREDAFDGLVALCWKARGNLCILPTWSEKAQGETLITCTRGFIELFVLDFFNRYEGQTEEQILFAALNNRFRYIGHKLQGSMTDEIRRRTAAKNREPWRESLEKVEEHITDCELSATDYHSTLSDATRPRYVNSTTPLDFLKARETNLTDAIGPRGYQALEAIVEAFPEAYECTDQAGKSALTRAIARRREISEQQARTDKRELTARVSEEMQRGNRDLNDLHELLARGDDDHTLREDYISRDGRRRRSIRLRIELPRKLSF